ncbi:peptide chain release factor N(5)-glutamine methyltransferase [Flavobacterium sp.]|uniref:peptide chain release factor N(5)-glutamine methyltransferase n=1 Tax=Flavobacterium sp. TaxID=239 RepID=UPI003BD180A4
MLFKTYKTTFLQELSTFYDEQEIESFFYLTLECFHNKKRIDLALDPNMEMDAMQLRRWESALAELKKEKPIQYILGETEFYGIPFLVNENTLIPRPETEELVEWIIKSTSYEIKSAKLQILDIGTGSGCIAISLAKSISNAEVFAIDISEEALATAKKNAEINEVNVDFILKNVLETENLGNTFDIIVSNPPYVRNLEKSEIKPNVLEYEPHIALFVNDNDALLFYRKIAGLAKVNLSENGILFFEINQYLGKETVELLEDLGFKNIILKNDNYGNNRMISCCL